MRVGFLQRAVPVAVFAALMAWHAWATPFRSAAGTDAALQVLALDWLRGDPLGPIWRLHAQPPLWNCWVAAVLRTGAGVEIVASLALGVAGVLVLVRRFVRGWATSLALAAALLSPDLYAAWSGGTYDWAALWAAAGFCLALYDARIGTACALAVVLTLLRTHFHPALLAGSVALAWWSARPRPRLSPQRLAAVAMAAALVAAWPVKNWAMYGQACASSWGSYTGTRGTPWHLTWWECFARRPDLRAAAVARWSDGHPATASDLKPSGAINWNHAVLLALAPLAREGWRWKAEHLGQYAGHCAYFLSVALCRGANERAPTAYSAWYDGAFPRWTAVEAAMEPARRRLEGWMSAHSCPVVVNVAAVWWLGMAAAGLARRRARALVVFAGGLLALACLTDGVEAYRTCLSTRWALWIGVVFPLAGDRDEAGSGVKKKGGGVWTDL